MKRKNPARFKFFRHSVKHKRPKGVKKKSHKLKRKRRQIAGFLRKWLPRFLIGALITALLGGAYYLIFQTETFHTSYFEVTGASKYVNSTDLKNFLYSNHENDNLLFLDAEELATNLEELFLGAQKIELKKRYPDKLHVQVTERTPLAVLTSSQYSNDYMVDKEGYVLGIVDSTAQDLPRINYVGDLKIGSFVNKDLVPVYSELLAALEETNVKVSSMSFHPRHVSFYVEEGAHVLVDNERNKFQALEVLSRLLRKLTLEGKKASKIDLRYDKVVVSY
ncbi:FtsQ-type POTRA domain-containing protein [candidate division WWE3 bacterium]|nr:FtsQ-type POTRA domain-containing protein [candidate division WWE3 bacterium]